MSNAEQAFQRFIDYASELEGKLRLSRVGEGSAIRSSLLKIHSWLNFVRSGEVGIASLALSLVVQMGLPAEFPTHTTNYKLGGRGILMFTLVKRFEKICCGLSPWSRAGSGI